MTDSDAKTRDTLLTMIGRLSPSERFVRALSLSVYVRQLAWQGARLHAGSCSEAAVVDRFLTQLYGADVATSFRAASAHRSE